MIYRITLFFVAMLLMGGLEMGCYYDNEEDLYSGNGNLDSCNVNGSISYFDVLVPLLEQNCNIACHNATDRVGNVVLDDYDNLLFYVNDNNRFIKSIRHEGIYPMPPGSKLSTCDIERFEKWIEEGALDN